MQIYSRFPEDAANDSIIPRLFLWHRCDVGELESNLLDDRGGTVIFFGISKLITSGTISAVVNVIPTIFH